MKNYTVIMAVHHGDYLNVEKATAGNIDSALADVLKTEMGRGYGFDEAELPAAIAALRKTGVYQFGWADYKLEVSDTMKTNTQDKATARPFNPNLDSTVQDFSPATDKFGALNHNLRLAVSSNSSATFKNVYLSDIMTDVEAAQKEHAALVAVAEAAQDCQRGGEAPWIPGGTIQPLIKALANLAAIRNKN